MYIVWPRRSSDVEKLWSRWKWKKYALHSNCYIPVCLLIIIILWSWILSVPFCLGYAKLFSRNNKVVPRSGLSLISWLPWGHELWGSNWNEMFYSTSYLHFALHWALNMDPKIYFILFLFYFILFNIKFLMDLKRVRDSPNVLSLYPVVSPDWPRFWEYLVHIKYYFYSSMSSTSVFKVNLNDEAIEEINLDTHTKNQLILTIRPGSSDMAKFEIGQIYRYLVWWYNTDHMTNSLFFWWGGAISAELCRVAVIK